VVEENHFHHLYRDVHLSKIESASRKPISAMAQARSGGWEGRVGVAADA
jgi:hypothetical protein